MISLTRLKVIRIRLVRALSRKAIPLLRTQVVERLRKLQWRRRAGRGIGLPPGSESDQTDQQPDLGCGWLWGNLVCPSTVVTGKVWDKKKVNSLFQNAEIKFG